MSDGKWPDHWPIKYKGFTICKACNIILCKANAGSECHDEKPRNAKNYIDNLKAEKEGRTTVRDLQSTYQAKCDELAKVIERQLNTACVVSGKQIEIDEIKDKLAIALDSLEYVKFVACTEEVTEYVDMKLAILTGPKQD